ncbi:alpha-L-fucosidase [Flavihumibacter petaseus]|uniref:alpha-L-fucosidase n=1 Tax=Flavihumibacter petaseus NBRC 106054 TaxID=1220578 RepID=A0A0E9MY10_9BACT|nr:alpha-L-fucosidase [Flavihumibacter petaseus]GAO42010.1 putative alpha-L-fucosidase [Flavihumibacter petaseus NBRC 106054]
MKYSVFVLLCLFSAVITNAQQRHNPVPTKDQLAWHDQEFYWFIHFGPNTFTGKEWGHGDEKEAIFQPTALDCDQWVRVAKQSGATGIILTAKHHDGFCLWPSKYSQHTVAQSPWRDGKGDVLKLLSDACRRGGLKFGVYISPWDRNHPAYGTPAYNDIYINTMKEIFAAYGPIWELWWDGANGEGPNGKKMVYDFRLFEKTIRKISPHTVIFSDIGPDIRWVGNENGIAGTTNWNRLDTAGYTRGAGAPSQDTLNAGNRFGANWIPAECDVSIRPGWFYHAEEDTKVKSPADLFRLYLKSVGRGANFLLNVPPDTRGLIHEQDSIALNGFRQLLTDNFSRPLGQYDAATTSIKLTKPTAVNCVVLQEDLTRGQQVATFELQLEGADGVTKTVNGTTIGHKRILCFPDITVKRIRIVVTASDKKAVLKPAKAFRIDPTLLVLDERL